MTEQSLAVRSEIAQLKAATEAARRRLAAAGFGEDALHVTVLVDVTPEAFANLEVSRIDVGHAIQGALSVGPGFVAHVEMPKAQAAVRT